MTAQLAPVDTTGPKILLAVILVFAPVVAIPRLKGFRISLPSTTVLRVTQHTALSRVPPQVPPSVVSTPPILQSASARHFRPGLNEQVPGNLTSLVLSHWPPILIEKSAPAILLLLTVVS